MTCSSTGATSTVSGASRRSLSSRVRRSRSSVMRLSRSASLPMSVTKSRTVSISIWSVCKMESVNSRIAANGVFSSWLASDTNRRRKVSVV